MLICGWNQRWDLDICGLPELWFSIRKGLFVLPQQAGPIILLICYSVLVYYYTMAVGVKKEVSVFGRRPVQNRICKYWLQGRCNRNSCRFMHRESSPPHTDHPQSLRHADIHQKQPRKATWTNPNYQKRLSKEGNPSSRTSNGNIQKKVSVGSGRKSGHPENTRMEVSTVARTEPEKNNVRKAQPMQCKDWVTGNCVRGDKCKDMHSWFCGSGFTMLAKLEGHTKAITGIALPSGHDKLYSVGKDGAIRAWDCHNGQCAGSETTDGEVGCLMAEGSWVFIGLPNCVKAVNLQNRVEFCLSGPDGLVCSMTVGDDKLFAGIEDGTILVWKWNMENSPEPAGMLKEHTAAVCSLVVGAANRLYSAARDSTIKVWDRKNLQCLQTLYGHTSDVMSVICWECYLISASLDNTLKVWCATESGKIEMIHEIKEDHAMLALCDICDADVKPILLCSCGDNTVRLYDVPSFVERGRIFSKSKVEVIEIGTGGLFFTGDASGEVSVWKLLGDPHPASS